MNVRNKYMHAIACNHMLGRTKPDHNRENLFHFLYLHLFTSGMAINGTSNTNLTLDLTSHHSRGNLYILYIQFVHLYMYLHKQLHELFYTKWDEVYASLHTTLHHITLLALTYLKHEFNQAHYLHGE